MAFISLSPELKAKSFTGVENKFITKYMPALDGLTVKVYLYGLYLSQTAGDLSSADLAAALKVTEEQVSECYECLDEFELVKITSRSPLEVVYLDAENISGAPKKYKPEKYADFARSVQSIIKGRMISTSEYREYFYLMDEYGFEQSALLMIVNYCVNMKGDDIRIQYIKKVAKSFAAEGAVTAKKVDEKLASFTTATPALLKIFSAAGISRRPGIDDEKLYKKWSSELGFSDEAIAVCAKLFKAKTVERIDGALEELYANKKFDVKEIEYYSKARNSIHSATIEIAKSLGLYVQNAAPYIENYVGVWCDYGYELPTLKKLSAYCFLHGKKSFEAMDGFIGEMYEKGIIDDKSVKAYTDMLNAEDEFIKKVLAACGLTRRAVPSDKSFVGRWHDWNFSDEMILKAAEFAAGKNNPLAYMNGVLSSWKQQGIFTPDAADGGKPARASAAPAAIDRATIERHYANLRQIAENRAESAQKKALEDGRYAALHSEIQSLGIQLAIAEAHGDPNAEQLEQRIAERERAADERLKELGIDKDDFTPRYQCKICGDTGYDANGLPCTCLKKFIAENS